MPTNPRRTSSFWLNRNHLAQFVDLGATHGLEIGAMDLPLVEPGEGTCDFADYRTTEELRTLAAKTTGHNPDFVVPVAFDLRAGYAAVDRQYDWIGASHVVEHVPDLIGWIDTLHSKLKPGGVLFLVVPDKRFTFDYHRRVTNLSDAVSAHRQQLPRPSYAQVFDHYFYTTAQLPPHDIWKGAQPPPPLRDYSVANARAESALANFEDAHCSVFTPDSFADLINDLTASGLLKFRMDDMRPTQDYELDFSVVFRKV